MGGNRPYGALLELLRSSRQTVSRPSHCSVRFAQVEERTEDRPIATTLHPYATVGEVAFLQVAETNAVGAFLDWGLDGKDLLVPFREQKSRMLRGGIYPVYVYLDHTTGRVVASAKIEKFLGNTIPHYRRGAGVKVLVMGRTEIGYRVIVDNLFLGMLYENEVYRDITVGESMEAYVKNVRPDGKIDVTLNDSASRRITPLADNITEYLASHGGKISITDYCIRSLHNTCN